MSTTPVRPAQAGGEVLRFWRDWVRGMPDELCTMAAFLYALPAPFVPPGVQGTPIFVIACFHTDLKSSAEDDLRPLREQNPALDVLGPMPYMAIQGMFDEGVPRGSRNYWRSGLVDELADEAIHAIVSHAEGIPVPLGQLHVHQLGGAMSRVPAGATAFGNRDAGFLMNYIGLWLDSAQDEADIEWVRAASDAMEPHGTGRCHVSTGSPATFPQIYVGDADALLTGALLRLGLRRSARGSGAGHACIPIWAGGCCEFLSSGSPRAA
jgi:hypothetical protein